MTAAKQYNDVAQRLQAVQQLTAYFNAYDQVPKVHELSQAIVRIQASLRRQIQVEFDNQCVALGAHACERLRRAGANEADPRWFPDGGRTLVRLNPNGELVGNATILADACSVIAVLDADFKYVDIFGLLLG